MVIAGWGASNNITTLRMVVGFIMLAISFFCIHNIAVENKDRSTRVKRNIVYFFMAIWIVYGIVAILSSNNVMPNGRIFSFQMENISYNLLDCISKAIFGLCTILVSIS